MPYAERVAIQIELGDALRLAGDPAHLEVARDALDQALGLGDEQLIAAACFALLQLGATSSSGTPNSDLDPLLERAFATLQSPALRAPVLGAASLAWSLSGDAARCREYFNAADELAGTGPDRARILPFAYMALGLPGDLDRRRTAARELLACGAELSDPVLQFEGWQLTFSVALQDGDGEGVRSAQKEMDALVDQVGDVGRRWARHFCLAAVAHLDGNEDASEQFAGEAYAIFAPVSPPRALAAYTGQLFAIRMTQGRLAELAEPLASLVQDQPGIPAWHAAYAVASASAGGDPDTIALHADRAIDLAQPDATWLAAHAVGARAVAMIGAESLARRYVDLLEPWTGRMVWQGTCTYGPVDTALAMLHHALGDDDKARHHLVRAREGIERLDASPFAKELDAWAAAT